jgi:oxidase EvaA
MKCEEGFACSALPGHADIIASRTSMPALHDDSYVDDWVCRSRAGTSLRTTLTSLDTIKGWARDPLSGNISHVSGRFFSVIGIHARHRVNQDEIEWDQPIIEQPEIGILGILAKKINGVLHFCLQAKEEPGNIGAVQLSPTVQATYSNYTGVHGGSIPPFLQHFMAPHPDRIIFARLQTEDGGRFLFKSNRNMIVSVADDVPDELPDGFIWLTLRQIARLLHRDSLINACARSVLSCLLPVSLHSSDVGVAATSFPAGVSGDDQALVKAEKRFPATNWSMADIGPMLQWLDDRRTNNHMVVSHTGLNALQEWHFDDKGFFSHKENRFFRIVGLAVTSETREVRQWGQPIIENLSAGIIGLLVRRGPAGMEVLMQAKAEAGNRVTVQLGPTVQFTQGNYAGSKKLKHPFLFDEFSDPTSFELISESRQAEEGARFYREYHLHRILLLPDGVELQIPPDYRWLPIQQIVFLLHLGEQVNSCARSILSCLL